jgi:hypothetical protein
MQKKCSGNLYKLVSYEILENRKLTFVAGQANIAQTSGMFTGAIADTRNNFGITSPVAG